MNIDLTGRVAVITGGGGGIGRAGALCLANCGADIVILDIETSRCEKVAEEIKAIGPKALAIPTDVMETAQIRDAIKQVDKVFGRADVLINNAGGTRYVPFLEQSERSWRKHIDINLVSMFAATSAVVPLMIRGGVGGSIVNVSSIEASRGGPMVAVYAACKAGMENFTRSMALELSAHEIRVNCIAPDKTVTPGARGNRTGPIDRAKWRVPTAEEQDKMNRLIPLLREGEDTECGDAIVFLCSDMSSYVTGVTLPVDGGTSAAKGWHRGSKGQWTQLEGLRPDR